MKVSQIGLISKKITKLDELYPVQDMLMQTGQVDQFCSGIYAYGHIPYLVLQNIKKVISDCLTKYGCTEISLPLMQPEAIWEESGRLKKYVDDGVMFRCLTDKGNYCLAPTAEEAVVAYAKKRNISYKQLPVTYFQIGEKFRNEIRTRGYLLRGKSFVMMDAYSFGRSKEELSHDYENMKKAYLDIFAKLGLNVIPVGADSGAIGGSKSEEFMCLSNFGEDTVYFEPESGKAFNSELLERDDYEKYLDTTYGIKNTSNLEKRKAVELGHIFCLGTKYSEAMNGNFINEKGVNKNYIMGCYGIGVSRTLAMVYENSAIYKDGKFSGIVLPESINPYKLHIVAKTDDAKKLDLANNLYTKLNEKGLNVLYDDREEVSIGAKIKDSKMLGARYLLIMGNTLDDGFVELENNETLEKEKVSLENLEETLINLIK